MATSQLASGPQVGKLLSVVPVGLKEAALDSPTFHATTSHFADQLELLERWLDGYARAAAKIVAELSPLEQALSSLLAYTTNPINVSEAVVDHDYTLLAVKRHGDCMREIWGKLFDNARKLDQLVAEPIRAFIQGDLKNFKEVRRNLDQTQKQYENLLAKYSAQSKSKEPSSLREDAFQLHEARKAYLKASLDFSVQAPQLRNTLDKLLVRISVDQWRETKLIHDASIHAFSKWGQDMDRIKGWINEMENSERYNLRELHAARKQVEEAAELAARPSRELDDYSVSTVPYLGRAPSALKNNGGKPFKPEKQGWVYLRTTTGKPTRTVWVRRWVFLRKGIFGCLVHSSRTGGVEETERVGVLLCNIRPAFQEERRFCFEVKTKKNAIMLQAESQKDLVEWIGAFEAAKQKALENPASTDLSVSGKFTVQDPAFSVSQPPVPEFMSDNTDFLHSNGGEDSSSDRLSVPDREPAVRSSGDFGTRRSTQIDGEERVTRDHASRIIQKLDLHRKSSMAPPSPLAPGGGSGTPSPMSTSHTALPGVSSSYLSDLSRGRDDPQNNLAPTTLANPPAPTSTSKLAVHINCERGIGIGSADSTGGVPSGVQANLWGSANWGFLNTFRDDGILVSEKKTSDDTASSQKQPASSSSDAKGASSTTTSPASSQPTRHRQTVSLDGDSSKLQRSLIGISHEYPSYYPPRLRFQDAQFRLLFPNVKREESLVMVFRAAWNPNDQQEFPGRAFVTTRKLYFYSHHFGLVLTTSTSLNTVSEVTAASGRDCDFLYLHINRPLADDMPRRVTVKTFLEPLRLLQRRLNYLVTVASSNEPPNLESILKTLIKMEMDAPSRSVSADSWEDISMDGLSESRSRRARSITRRSHRDFRAPIYVEKDLYVDSEPSHRGRDVHKVKLPANPVQYTPQGNLHLAAERYFDISSKALFHVLFGDKSPVWQLLLHERRAQGTKRGPWRTLDSGHMRRDFEYSVEISDMFGRTSTSKVWDYQIIDVLNDHLCYVVTDKRTPWHLPFRRNYRLVSKVVITYVARSKCKLAIYAKVEWLWSPFLLKNVIDGQAIQDLEQDAQDLVELVIDQVRKLGHRGRTKKAIATFGLVGHETNVSQLSVEHPPTGKSRQQRSLGRLLAESLVSLLRRVVLTLMMWAFAAFRWVWKTCSAHGLLLALLVLSVLANGFFTWRSSLDWWHERNAAQFMARLGIRPDRVMSKAIYIRDLDEVVFNTTARWESPANASRCFATFHEQTLVDDGTPLLSLASSGGRGFDPVERSAGRRVQRTRQRLGVYRHDLLVALRVVNRIEREVLQSEWERWLEQETGRCRQVESLLKSHEIHADGQGPHQDVFSGRREDVQRWYEEYCGSCQEERERLAERSSLI